MDSPALTSAHLSSSGKGRHSNLNGRGRVKGKVERKELDGGSTVDAWAKDCVRELLSPVLKNFYLSKKPSKHLVK